MDEELKDVQRVLVVSARNMLRNLDEASKKSVLSILEPVLQRLVDDASHGLMNETKSLLMELGVFNLAYDKLEALYVSEIKKHKSPAFFRSLILDNHHDKIPKLRLSYKTPFRIGRRSRLNTSSRVSTSPLESPHNSIYSIIFLRFTSTSPIFHLLNNRPTHGNRLSSLAHCARVFS
jgi:hypothetical protein